MTSGRVKLGLLIACLAGLVAFLLVTQLPGGSGQSASACSSTNLPAVRQVAPSGLGDLRRSIAGVLPDRIGELYEEGTVLAGNAFSDDAPAPPPVDPAAPRPAAYEMRWWAPNRDDVVADVFMFSDARSAQRFLERAITPRCRRSGAQLAALQPPEAQNLTWTNPDGVAEADVYLARGPRVYRVADAPAGRHRQGLLRRALVTVDTLACLLPEAQCSSTRRLVPA